MAMCCACICGVLLLASAQGGEARKGGGLRKARPSPWHAADGTGGVRSGDGVKPVFATGFKELISAAQAHPRRRRMIDFTRTPSDNGLQNLMNVWTEGSYSPVHLHEGWAETRVRKLALGRGSATWLAYGEGTCCGCLVAALNALPMAAVPRGAVTCHSRALRPRRSSRSKARWPSSRGLTRATRPLPVLSLAHHSATSSSRAVRCGRWSSRSASGTR